MLKQKAEDEEERLVTVGPHRVHQKVRPGEPAGPVSGGAVVPKRTLKTSLEPYYNRNTAANKLFRDMNEKKTLSSVQITSRLENSRVNLAAKSDENDPATVSYNTKVFNKEVISLRNE